MLGVLTAIAPTVSAIQVKVIEKQRTTLGISLTLRGRLAGNPLSASYILRRKGKQWKIVYDSMVGDAIADYVQAQEQDKIDPAAKKPSRRAIAAGKAAAQTFQRVLQSDTPR